MAIDSYTKLLLHCDGADASTSFPDASLSAHSVTAAGNAQVDTAQSVFGGASLLLDGTGDYLTSADHADWILADFTIDLRARWAATDTGTHYLVAQIAADNTQRSFTFYYQNGNLGFADSTNGTAWADNVTVAWTPSTNTWYHVEVDRSGTSLYFFVDGSQVGATQTVTGSTLFDSNQALTIGSHSTDSLFFNGWMDEIRISNGIARHTAPFTPPISPYPYSLIGFDRRISRNTLLRR